MLRKRSPQAMLFQYQAGPRSSYFEISSSENGLDGANIGGSWIVGVAGSSGTVRSTMRMPPLTIPAASSASVAEPLAMTHSPVLRIELAQRDERLAHDAQPMFLQRQQRTTRIAAGQPELVERCLEDRLAGTEAAGVVGVEPRAHQRLVTLAEASRARQIVRPDRIEIVRQLATEHRARAHRAVPAVLLDQHDPDLV